MSRRYENIELQIVFSHFSVYRNIMRSKSVYKNELFRIIGVHVTQVDHEADGSDY
jgi:hypothetical protein